MPSVQRHLFSPRIIFTIPLSILILSSTALPLFAKPNPAGSVTAKVRVIIDKLPIEKEEKMKDFYQVIKTYIENVEWLEEDDRMPIELSLQLFLTESLSNVEDRYNCEFLISGSDVQYFDKRVRFPFQPGDIIQYNPQSVEPLTAVLNFYINLVLGSELDKARGLGGEVYYKRAQNFAALGKFVRTEFVYGWNEREEIVKYIFSDPFTTFRKMKDYYFYGLYVLQEEGGSKQEAREYMLTALKLVERVIEKRGDLDEPKQFLDAHHPEIVELFKDYAHRDDVFRLLIKVDPDHRDIYEESMTGS